MAIPDNPITREELYYSAMAGQNTSLPEPITRKEFYLAKAAGMAVESPTPITREEQYLEAIQTSGGGSSPSSSKLGAVVDGSVTELTAKDLEGAAAIVPCQFSNNVPVDVTTMPVRFSNLKRVEIPGNVLSVGACAFQKCTSLEELVLSEGIETIDKYAFSGCTALERVTIPASVKTMDMAVFDGAGLTEAVTPTGIFSLPNSTYNNCASLKKITVTENIGSIGRAALTPGDAIEEYHMMRSTPPSLGRSVYLSMPEGCVVYVPKGSLEAYKSATNWAAYADFMQEEP